MYYDNELPFENTNLRNALFILSLLIGLLVSVVTCFIVIG